MTPWWTSNHPRLAHRQLAHRQLAHRQLAHRQLAWSGEMLQEVSQCRYS